MKKTIAFIVVSAAFALHAAVPRNIILFIGDGMSVPQRMTADEFARKAGLPPLVMNRLPCQATTRTCSANSLVTDSAAAATAIACGEKTYNHGMGVDKDGKRLTSCAEVAKANGRKVGIVTTVTIDHATPSGFYAHRKDRGESYAIGLDMIASGFDLFAGGGQSRPDDRKNALYKGDLYDLAAKAGYTVIREDRAAFEALKPGCGKVWYAAAKGAMPNSIDADQWRGVPTLAELTRKSIELLDGSEKGFFLMVEGGRIDWAGHANDPATNLREVLALDEAVRVALEFQKAHPETLVITTGDHETGGMTMGFASTGYAFYMDRLANQRRSADSIREFVGKKHPATFEDVKPFLSETFGLDFTSTDARTVPMAVTKDELRELETAFSHDLEMARKGKKDDEAYDAAKVSRLPTVVKSIFSHKCGIGWSSGSHTALPVLTTAGGPGAERFVGFIDNTDISKIVKELVK